MKLPEQLEFTRPFIRPRILWSVGGVLLILVAAALTRTETEGKANLFVKPVRGPFHVTVTATGELQAKNSVKIYGPTGAQQQRIYEMKITQLIPEGTVVKKGDFVAELDKSQLTSNLKDAELELQKSESQYEQTMLDSMMTLSKAREDRVNLHYALEEAKLRNNQSRYEAPSIQRQAEIDYEKAQRAYDQSLVNYQTQVRQAEAKMSEAEAELTKSRKKVQDLHDLASQFSITAPANGMLVYRRDWRGNRLTVGGTVNSWDPVVAELPDLSQMESVTYINEVDIQKIREGQHVEIGLDANPDKKLTGTVTRVANIGEQRPESDAKVFEVVVQVAVTDSTLRPAMTTSNTIEVAEVPDALQIPLEAVHAADSVNYVYVHKGGGAVRQEVRLGLLNENNAVVDAGLSPDVQVYLSTPADTAGIAFNRLQPVDEKVEEIAEERR